MFAQIGYYICVPFAWLTRLFYSLTGSYGLALILFTLVVKLVILPFQLKSKKSMLRMNRMQGKVKDIQTRFANNRERQQQEMADLYAREGVNPMSGCLWSFIPFPILIALYAIIRTPLRYFMSLSTSVIEEIGTLAGTLGYEASNNTYDQIYLAKFIHEHWESFAGKFDGLVDLNYSFLGMDLASQPSTLLSQFPGGGWPVWGILLLPVISAAAQLVMSIITMRTNSTEGAGSAKTMMYLMPLMTLWMGYMLPAALCIYWIANTVFSLIQEVTLNKYFNKILDREETEKEKAAREKRYAKYQKQKELMAQQQMMADLYAREGVNPMSGCLWSFIPFPILIALYAIIRTPLRYFMSLSTSVIEEIGTLAGTLGYEASNNTYDQIYLAKFIHEHWESFAGKFDGLVDLNYSFLGMDLASQPSTLLSQFPGGGWPVWGILLLPVISAAAQLVMSIITMRTNSTEGAGSAKTMMYLMPLMTLWMGYMLPAALCIYWIANTVFSLIQEVTLNKYFNKILDREETEKEKAAREKRYAKYQKQKELMAQQQMNGGGRNDRKPQPKKKKQGGEEKHSGTNENGRVGQRPYARGRAYDEKHYE